MFGCSLCVYVYVYCVVYGASAVSEASSAITSGTASASLCCMHVSVVPILRRCDDSLLVALSSLASRCVESLQHHTTAAIAAAHCIVALCTGKLEGLKTL